MSKDKQSLTGFEVNEDGQTKLYQLCSYDFGSRYGLEAIRELINSYPVENRAAIVNQKVKTPERVKRFVGRTNVSLEGYNIGNSPLHIATRNNSTDVVKTLLDFGADPNAVNDKGFTALDEAIQNKNPETVKFLIESGAKVNVTDKNMDTPLMLAHDMLHDDPNNIDIKKVVKLITTASKNETAVDKKTKGFLSQTQSFIRQMFSSPKRNESQSPNSQKNEPITSKKSSDSLSSNVETEVMGYSPGSETMAPETFEINNKGRAFPELPNPAEMSKYGPDQSNTDTLPMAPPTSTTQTKIAGKANQR
jgi:ankyrin repeat protein